MKNTFTKEEVKDIVLNVFDYYNIEDHKKFGMGFEKRLNAQGLNGNNGDNERLTEKYLEDEAKSFII